MRSDTTRSTSQVLDGVRAIAALAVFTGHLRNLFFVDYGELDPPPNLLVKGFYFASGFGHAAVIVFFVLSGYFIASSTIRSTASITGWSWGRYGLQRLTRLYVVLVPALLLGAVWDLLGMSLEPLPGGIYSRDSGGEYSAMLAVSVPEAATACNWLGSLLFLQGIVCAPFGSNGPLWSLSCEFWYYVIFPLAYLSLTTKGGTPRLKASKFVMGLTALLLGILIGPKLWLYFCIWLLGAAVAFARPIPLAATRPAFLVSVLFLAAALIWSRLSGGTFAGDAVVGVACALSLYTLLCQRPTRSRNEEERLPRLLRFGGSISFSLYLLHVPFLVFLNGQVIGAGARWFPDAKHLAASFGITLITLAYVLLIWWLTEAKTELVRRYAIPRFFPTAALPARKSVS